MDTTTRRAAIFVAAALILSVVTQIVYMLALGGPSASDPSVGVTNADRAAYFTDRWAEIAMVWTIELALFTGLAAAAFVALARGNALPTTWAALALAGIFNVIQLGIGLTMFAPAATAGEALSPLLTTVLGGAFFFYFLAKVLIGLAGIGFGLALLGQGSTAVKAVGLLSIVVGIGAAAINILAIPQGLSMVFMAGAAGTVAALTTGVAIWLAARAQD